MKFLLFAFVTFFITNTGHAQGNNTDNQSATVSGKRHAAIERLPQYPGGQQAFARSIASNLKYPELAALIGINGSVNVSFVIDTTGRLTDVTPLNCIGAGCEAEAVNALYKCKTWQPGMQDNKHVRVKYTVPIVFDARKSTVNFKDLKRSKYGFIFDINGNKCSLDEAEKILGKSFPSNAIEIANPYSDPDKHPELQDKEVYLIKIKSA